MNPCSWAHGGMYSARVVMFRPVGPSVCQGGQIRESSVSLCVVSFNESNVHFRAEASMRRILSMSLLGPRAPLFFLFFSPFLALLFKLFDCVYISVRVLSF